MAGQVGHHYQEPSTSEWVESPTWQNYLPDQFQPSYELESLQYNDPNLFHPFIGDEGLYPYVDPGFLPIGGENQHLLWPIFERPAVPWTGNTPEASTAQELLPQKTKPVTTEEDHGGNSPGGSSYLTFSTPQLAGSGSSCSGSPAVPNTPCWTPLTKVDVAQGQFASSKIKERKHRRSARASKPTSSYCCTHEECRGGGFRFTSKSAMVRHRNENHPTDGGKIFFCPDESCPRFLHGFPRRHNLKVHMNGQKHRENLSSWEDYLRLERRQGVGGSPNGVSQPDGELPQSLDTEVEDVEV